MTSQPPKIMTDYIRGSASASHHTWCLDPTDVKHSLCPLPPLPEDRAAKPVEDNVNHPVHYNSHPSGVECITIVRHMTFNTGNVIKYLWRAGLKGVSKDEPDRERALRLQDLRKALWYLNDEIERLEFKGVEKKKV